MVSIQNILDSATNLLLTISDSPRLDAEVLLAFIVEKIAVIYVHGMIKILTKHWF